MIQAVPVFLRVDVHMQYWPTYKFEQSYMLEQYSRRGDIHSQKDVCRRNGVGIDETSVCACTKRRVTKKENF